MQRWPPRSSTINWPSRWAPARCFLNSADLKPGDDWKNALDERVGSCSALLAVIGKTWVSPRLAEPSDVVRFEIETALHRDVRVIPVLVDGAEKLDEKELPDSLKMLSNRQWVKIPNEKPEYGLNELSQLLSKVLRGIDNPEKSAPPTAAAPPGRTDERLGRIASAIDAAFGAARDLDNLLVFTLGEELRDASLGNSSAGRGPTIDLVKALHAEGSARAIPVLRTDGATRIEGSWGRHRRMLPGRDDTRRAHDRGHPGRPGRDRVRLPASRQQGCRRGGRRTPGGIR